MAAVDLPHACSYAICVEQLEAFIVHLRDAESGCHLHCHDEGALPEERALIARALVAAMKDV